MTTKKNGLLVEVLAALSDGRVSSCNDIYFYLDDFSRQQVSSSIRNAVDCGHILKVNSRKPFDYRITDRGMNKLRKFRGQDSVTNENLNLQVLFHTTVMNTT